MAAHRAELPHTAPYHSVMRRGFFVFLIVLTLLRGLAGPAMAAGMAAPHAADQVPAAAARHAQHAEHTEDGRHGDHRLLAAPSAPPADAESAAIAAPCHEALNPSATSPAATASAHDPVPTCGPSGTAHAACADCDICHTAVVAPSALHSPRAANPGAAPDLHSSRFASALPAQVTKPPIS